MGECIGVIGDPIEHTLSPMMHNQLFKDYQLPHYYHAFHVKHNQLHEAVSGIRALGIKGINVTIPHKETIMPFLDEVDPEARMIGAVNTVVNQNGRLIGYNTDGLGFLKALGNQLNTKLAFKRILIIGAGGAARAVALTLSKYVKCPIDITNRTLEKANLISGACQSYVTSEALTLETAAETLSIYDLIINTTPVGMYPNQNHLPMSLEGVTPGTLCVDLIYRPLKTKWLEEAEALGCQTMNGIGMLVYQGALAFQRWFNQWPNTTKMEKQLTQFLEEQHVK